MKVLVINAGSSTYKFSLFDLEDNHQSYPQDPLWKAQLEYNSRESVDLLSQIKATLSPITSSHAIDIVGHRVVHGGDRLTKPVVITPEIKKIISEFSPLAPLHNPVNLRGIEIMETLLPSVKQVAVFDTAFHSTMPLVATLYALPDAWRKLGIRRYGFHGISHSYCSQRAATLLGHLPSKLVSCHLGNGSSLTAIADGKSVDTTMGFTPMEGVVMGTRSGSIDPGIPLYLQREHHVTWQELDRQLNDESGLKGLCGASDLREILKRKREQDAEASLAYDVLIHSLRRNIGAMIGSLGGLDALLFTGGIGEHAWEVRRDVCQGLGLALDPDKNQSGSLDLDISNADLKTKILAIKSREDLAIAEACIQGR